MNHLLTRYSRGLLGGMLSVLVATAAQGQTSPSTDPPRVSTTQPARRDASNPQKAVNLDGRAAHLEWDDVRLDDALQSIGQSGQLNLHVNWPALQAAGVDRQTPVSLHVRGVSLGKALQLLLGGLAGNEPITFVIDGGVLEILPQSLADQRMTTRLYPVADLLMVIPDFDDAPTFDLARSDSGRGGTGGGGANNGLFSQRTRGPDPQTRAQESREQKLIDLITHTIRPDIWRTNGGTASIRIFRGMMIVTAPQSVHQAIGGSR